MDDDGGCGCGCAEALAEVTAELEGRERQLELAAEYGQGLLAKNAALEQPRINAALRLPGESGPLVGVTTDFFGNTFETFNIQGNLTLVFFNVPPSPPKFQCWGSCNR